MRRKLPWLTAGALTLASLVSGCLTPHPRLPIRPVPAIAVATPDKIKSLEQELQKNPSPAGYRTLGHLFYKNKKIEESTAAFKKAVDLQPANSEIRTNYAFLLSRQGKYVDAESQLNIALRFSRPKDQVPIYHTMAKVYMRKGDYNTALLRVTRARAIDPSNNRTHILIERIKRELYWHRDNFHPLYDNRR